MRSWFGRVLVNCVHCLADSFIYGTPVARVCLECVVGIICRKRNSTRSSKVVLQNPPKKCPERQKKTPLRIHFRRQQRSIAMASFLSVVPVGHFVSASAKKRGETSEGECGETDSHFRRTNPVWPILSAVAAGGEKTRAVLARARWNFASSLPPSGPRAAVRSDGENVRFFRISLQPHRFATVPHRRNPLGSAKNTPPPPQKKNRTRSRNLQASVNPPHFFCPTNGEGTAADESWRGGRVVHLPFAFAEKGKGWRSVKVRAGRGGGGGCSERESERERERETGGYADFLGGLSRSESRRPHRPFVRVCVCMCVCVNGNKPRNVRNQSSTPVSSESF